MHHLDKASTIGLKNDKDEVILYPEYVAHNFSSFFVEIVTKLFSKLPPYNFSVSDVDDFYETNNVCQDSFRLEVITGLIRNNDNNI